MAPLAGEQILTVLLTVAVHAANATFAEAKRKVAARRVRSEIIRGPVSETKLPAKCHGQAKSVDVAPPPQAHFVPAIRRAPAISGLSQKFYLVQVALCVACMPMYVALRD